MEQAIRAVIDALEAEQPKKAKRKFDALLKQLHGKDAEQWEAVGYAFQSLGFLPYATAVYQAAAEAFPDEWARWQVLLAEAAGDDGDFDQMLDLLLTIEPESDYYLQSLLLSADAYEQLHAPDISLMKLEEAKALAPDEPAVLLGLAALHLSAGRYRQAAGYFKQLLTAHAEALTEATRRRVREQYAEALSGAGEYEDAIKLREALLAEQEQASVAEALAYDYVKTGAFERAEALLSPRYLNGTLSNAALPLYAEVLTQLHQTDDAARVLDEAVAKNPYNAALKVTHAKQRLAGDQTETAIRDLEDALALDSEQVEARLLLIQALLTNDDIDAAYEQVEIGKERLAGGDFYRLAAAVYDRHDDIEQATEMYRRAYSELADDASFVAEYLQFMRTIGDWDAIGQAFEHQPALQQSPDIGWLYDEWLEHSEGWDEW